MCLDRVRTDVNQSSLRRMMGMNLRDTLDIDITTNVPRQIT